VGNTKQYAIDRSVFYSPQIIVDEVQKHLDKLNSKDKPDFLTFVSNGEPTLDINLGETIRLLKQFQIPVAVITNASLLHLPEVRENLLNAQWVSVKVDAPNLESMKMINRPHPSFSFIKYIEGLKHFANAFTGTLVTETMLVKNLNDSESGLKLTAELVKTLNPSMAYISVPTRPPAVESIKVPDEETLTKAYQIYTQAGLNTELILGFEGTNTGFTGNIYEDILNICTVHPLREDTMQELLQKNNSDFGVVNTLMHNQLIQEVGFQSKRFYVRQFHS
jgi:wyosine [tRNA(Phe)-imidazoG37] synthetase (radical SAM superfamily)